MYKSYFKGLCLNIIGKSLRNNQIIKTEAPPMPKLAFGCTPEFLFKILTSYFTCLCKRTLAYRTTNDQDVFGTKEQPNNQDQMCDQRHLEVR